MQNKILGGFLFFFVIALLSSQSLMDLGSTLIAISVIYILYSSKKNLKPLPLPNLKLLPLFIVWIVVIVAGVLVHRQPDTPWLKNILEFRWILEFYFYVIAIKTIDPKEREFKKILPVIFVASAYAFIVYFLKYDPLHENWQDRYSQLRNYRTGGLFLNPMPLAHTYGCLAMLMLGPVFFWKGQALKKNIFWLITLAVTVAAVILTFTRGIWIGMFVGTAFMGFLINFKRGAKVLIASILVAAACIAVSPTIRDRIIFSFHPGESYDSERLTIWKANWLIFSENPILGLGYSENGRRVREYYDRMQVPVGFLESHAHNQYLHFLAGTGILGLLCYLVLIVLLFRQHLAAYRRYADHAINAEPVNNEPFYKGLALGVLGAEVCFYVAGVTESNFSIAKNRYMLLCIWALGSWLYLRNKAPSA